MLRASGETIEGPRPCDSFDAFIDEVGDLVVLLMDVQSSAATNDGFAESLMRETRRGLLGHRSLHEVISVLEIQLAARPSLEAGLVILRLSERNARAEVLNAGMPAVANAGPGEQMSLHPALSGPVGRRVGEVRPYEVVPLSWGSTWLTVSDGMTNGSIDQENVEALCAKLELCERGFSLTTASRDDQYDAFQSLLSPARFLRDDATFVLVSVAPSARFQSGIV
jgi:hypothetical protein